MSHHPAPLKKKGMLADVVYIRGSCLRHIPIAEPMSHDHRCGVLGQRGHHIGRKGSHFVANELLSRRT
jgi:hypothetical protein